MRQFIRYVRVRCPSKIREEIFFINYECPKRIPKDRIVRDVHIEFMRHKFSFSCRLPGHFVRVSHIGNPREEEYPWQ